MATIDVIDAHGATVTIQQPLTPGRSSAASSKSVALSNEDSTALGAVATQASLAAFLAANHTDLAAILAKLVAAPALDATLAAMSAKLTAVLGAAAYNTSLGVVTPRSATGIASQVAGSASAVTILAANAARLGGVIVNDSTAVLYLILSSTTPTSAIYTYKMQPQDALEIPANYTGIIKGIWASAVGNAVVTELT